MRESGTWAVCLSLGVIVGSVALGEGGTGYAKVSGKLPGARLGASAAASGDFDGDGERDDFAVGAPGENSGCVYLVRSDGSVIRVLGFGSGGIPGRGGGSVDWTANRLLKEIARITPTWLGGGGAGSGTVQIKSFGASVDVVGDLNGNGFDDVIVGAPDTVAAQAQYGSGAFFVIDGGTTTILHPQAADDAHRVVALGNRVSGLGDVNGDGRPDYAVSHLKALQAGEPEDPGHMTVYSGGSIGSTLGVFDGAEREQLGHAGDMVGLKGGYVAVSAPFAWTDNSDHTVRYVRGRVSVYRYLGGQNWEWRYNRWGSDDVTDPNDAALLGVDMDPLPDIDGDGIDELIVGAPAMYDNSNDIRLGAVVVFNGVNGGPGFVVWGEVDNGGFGARASGVGDVNGDGVADVAVAELEPNSRVSIYSGASALFLGRIADPTPQTGDAFPSALAGDRQGASLLVGDMSQVTAAGFKAGEAYIFDLSGSSLAPGGGAASGGVTVTFDTLFGVDETLGGLPRTGDVK